MAAGKFTRVRARSAARRKEKILLLAGSGLLFSVLILAALLFNSQIIKARDFNEVKVEQQQQEEVTLGTVILIAASSRVPKGTKLTPSLLREIHWPRDQVPEGAIRSLQELENMYSVNTLPDNQPIMRSSVSAEPPSFSIGELLPPGHRAVTIQVNATSAVEGWATPGAHVDVLLTYVDSRDGVTKTRVAVENAVVLSFRGSAKAPEKGDETDDRGVAMNITTATLAVPASDALKIQTAVQVGRITLALRNTNDIVTPGKNVFQENEWDQPKKQAEKRATVPDGHFAVVGKNGQRIEYVLRDGRWQAEGEADAY